MKDSIKDKVITLRVSSEDKKEVEASAKNEGFDSVSAYLLWLHRRNKKK